MTTRNRDPSDPSKCQKKKGCIQVELEAASEALKSWLKLLSKARTSTGPSRVGPGKRERKIHLPTAVLDLKLA